MTFSWPAFKENLEICFESLLMHKLRSFLTMLGIIFGVGAVIGMLSIGEGAKREALNLVKTMGSKHIIITEKDLPDEKLEKVRKFSVGLTERDARALLHGVPGAKDVITIRKVKIEEVWNERGKCTAEAFGVPPDYARVMNLTVTRGRFFDDYDNEECRQVCVIGRGVARKIFGRMNPVGYPLKVGRLWYRIVGVAGRVTHAKGKLKGVVAEDVDRVVYLPNKAIRARVPLEENVSPLHEISVTLNSFEHLNEKKVLVERLMKRLHLKQEDFTVTIPLLILRQQQETQRIFNIVMGLIAGISLIVGGIGIMNIMLASILERIREIGIRRAVGATRKEILIQFLTEAVFLSIIGGVAGIFLGFIIARGVALATHWTTVVAWWSVLLSTGVSCAVGIAFGFYPARRAASFSPITALRYE